ncbi:MAG TPA: LON peptidase substrate-binding domain-containing protein [Kribbellaceae bacterium]|nr:LON peptidase substrate-binding domain-containing protein [Kribbellaceae bacterium]
MDSRLPLLTVDTVLFPGLVAPVPVADVQNRAVIRDLQASGDEEMICGALAIRDGYELGDRVFRSLHGVGCAAVVSDITGEAGDDGEGPLEVTLTGSRRFRVVELDGDGDYLVAKVDWLGENAGSDPLGAASIALERFRRYADAVTEISRPGLHLGSLPDDPNTLSYLIAAAMVLIQPDRQRLLEIIDTTSRLAHLVGLIDSELAAMAALPSLPAIDISWSDLAPN